MRDKGAACFYFWPRTHPLLKPMYNGGRLCRLVIAPRARLIGRNFFRKVFSRGGSYVKILKQLMIGINRFHQIPGLQASRMQGPQRAAMMPLLRMKCGRINLQDRQSLGSGRTTAQNHP